MLSFEKISLERIVIFIEILNVSSSLNSEIIRGRFLRRAVNFDDTIEFMKELGLVTYEGSLIVLSQALKTFSNSGLFNKEATRNLIAEHVLRGGHSFSGYLAEFLSNFVLVDEEYFFVPFTSQRISYSSLRNFLIELGIVFLSHDDRKYMIASEKHGAVQEFIKKQKVSLVEFEEMQQRKKEIGQKAELRIMEYEKARLSNYPHLSKRIEHTARFDVRAGYDIRSYEKCSDAMKAIPRYIEVKAVPTFDLRFFWSRNEIEKSDLYRHLYYLYLLPVNRAGNLDLEHLLIINDPFVNVFRNKTKWARSFEALAFSVPSKISVCPE